LVHALCVYSCEPACVQDCCVAIGKYVPWCSCKIMEPNGFGVRPLRKGCSVDTSHLSAEVFRFGAFEASVHTGELCRDGVKIHLQGQPFMVLALLLERAGDLVTREEMRDRVWPENTFVEFDYALNTAIKKIRAVLGDDADVPRYIETIPRRGYRFIASVTAAPDSSCSTEEQVTEFGAAAAGMGWRRERPLLIGMMVMAFLLGYLFRRPAS
jgi:DNA-binding winged helix-turn-helix (wHTH) protein